MRREGPQDFMLKYLAFLKREPEHKSLTPKGFSLLMKARKKEVRHE
jgi:hypothetical protein